MHPLLNLGARVVPRSFKERLKEDLIRRLQAPSMELSLKNMRRLGFKPATIIDVGAHVGEWSLEVHEIFPQASILMIEAQESKAPTLDKIVQAQGGKIQRRIAVLGPENRENVPFRECDDAPTGSSMLECREQLSFRVVQRRMECLDDVLAGAGIAKPDFLKLDVQGYELEVLKGAPKTLAMAEVVLLEVSTIELYEGAPLFHEVIAFMHSHGYRAHDISTLMRQRSADTLLQVDVIFVRNDSPLIAEAIKGL